MIIIILAFNSDQIIAKTVISAKAVSENIVVIDSGSTDNTLNMLTDLGIKVIYRKFINYSDQRNWTIQEYSNYTWQLHLDADDVLDEDAQKSIRVVLQNDSNIDAYLIKRKTKFLNKLLKFGGTTTWHLRLFKSKYAFCEPRKYDQHFVSTGINGKLNGSIHDYNLLSISEWVARHNRWSDAEAEEYFFGNDNDNLLKPDLMGESRNRVRYYKGAYYKAPLFFRALGYFFYRYIFRLGFLDGRVGFIYAFLQALWFRMLVDIKIDEIKRQK